MEVSTINAHFAWTMLLFLCGDKELPVDLIVSRRFASRDSSTCVHVGYIPEERGEHKSVAMISNQSNLILKQRVTGYKEAMGIMMFNSEEEVRAMLMSMALMIHRETGETDFIGHIVDHPNLRIYRPGGIMTIAASVYVMSRQSS